jgi:hypothetical protein
VLPLRTELKSSDLHENNSPSLVTGRDFQMPACELVQRANLPAISAEFRQIVCQNKVAGITNNREECIHMPPKLSAELLTAALKGFEEKKRRLDSKINELRAILSGSPATATAAPEAPRGTRKKFSAASRRKMAMAQKARWAKIRGESEPSGPATPEAAKPKRKMSAAGRKAISEATKNRWAAFHAAKEAAVKTAKKTAVKKSKEKPAKASESAAATA